MRATKGALVGAAIGMLIVAAPAEAYVRPGETVRISEPLVETPAPEGDSFFSSISSDGNFVAFASTNDFLVGLDINPRTAITGSDVFVWDRRSGGIEMVSVNSRGLQGTAGNSLGAVTDGRGRHVAFSSNTPNLVDGDANLGSDVFVHDRRSSTTERISVGRGGQEGPPGSHQPSVSNDGRSVAFSGPPDLLPRGDAPPPPVALLANQQGQDIYVRDRGKDETARVSISSDGEPANGNSYCPSISGNGRFVAFTSHGTNLVDDDTNLVYDVFVHDLLTGETERVSLASDGSQATRGYFPGGDGSTSCSVSGSAISFDGRFVAFNTTAGNLVPRDTEFFGNSNDVFVHDRKTGRTERVSVTSNGQEAEGNSSLSSISSNGRFISFTSSATNLFRGDRSTPPAPLPETGPIDELVCSVRPCENEVLPQYVFGDSDQFIYDRLAGTVELISISHNGKEVSDCGAASVWSSGGSVNRDGRYVSFHSCASNVIADDSRRSELFRDHDLYLRDRGAVLDSKIWTGSMPRRDPQPSPLCTSGGCGGITYPAQGIPPSADLLHSSIAYRERHGDLFLTIDVEHLAPLRAHGANVGVSAPLYGASFSIGDNRYEVRAGPTLAPGGSHVLSIGLFLCDDHCREVTALTGGYGTTGERVVVSIPLDVVGTRHPYLTDVSAYSARGTYLTGAHNLLDVIEMNR